jgi:hypothetical protein
MPCIPQYGIIPTLRRKTGIPVLTTMVVRENTPRSNSLLASLVMIVMDRVADASAVQVHRLQHV